MVIPVVTREELIYSVFSAVQRHIFRIDQWKQLIVLVSNTQRLVLAAAEKSRMYVFRVPYREKKAGPIMNASFSDRDRFCLSLVHNSASPTSY